VQCFSARAAALTTFSYSGMSGGGSQDHAGWMEGNSS